MLYTFYLHYFTFLTITSETHNNIDSKAKALLKVLNFESRNENIVFLRKNQKINKREGPNRNGGVRKFFEKK